MSSSKRIQGWPELGKNTLIRLDDSEIKVAHLLGDMRNRSSRNLNVKDRAIDKDRNIDRLGAEAELAVHKLAGVYPSLLFDVSPKSKANSSDKGDLIIDGYSVDVKCTTHKNGRLIQTQQTVQDNIDMFCLVVRLEEGLYELKGFFPKRDLFVQERFGHHRVFRKPCFVAEQCELLSFADCVDRLNTESEVQQHFLIREASRFLKTTDAALRRKLNRGIINGVKNEDGKWLIPYSSLEPLLPALKKAVDRAVV